MWKREAAAPTVSAVNTEEKHLCVAESHREKNNSLFGEAWESFVRSTFDTVFANALHSFRAAMTGDLSEMR